MTTESNEVDLNEATYDLEAYIAASPEERLRLLCDARRASKDERHQAFYEGRMMEVTVDMDEHPEWFDYGCLCALCCSYA